MQEDLREWPYLRSILSSDPETQAQAVEELEKAPELAPPMVLLLTSRFYLEQNDKETAALYFLASKLRAEFDMKRWPVINESGIRARKKEHPAKETLTLSKTISKDLSGWILAKEPRAKTILNRLKNWEKNTPYHYRPTYDLENEYIDVTEADDWKDLHDEVVESFIKKQENILSIMHP